MTITVLKPGAFSQLQDRGRYGYQRFGVVVGGAMDEWSHRVANALVGNVTDEATLEITLTGPTLRFEKRATIAVCGADLSPQVDGPGGNQALPHGRPVLVEAGSQLRFGARVAGARAYLAVRGGLDVPVVMGSRSTYVRGGFGGLEGRALRTGDVLRLGGGALDGGAAEAPDAQSRASTLAALTMTVLPTPLVAPVAEVAPIQTIRIIAGRHWDRFTAQARALLLESSFRIGSQSDRMGYRLQGPVLTRVEGEAEMISEPVTFGTIQVPPDGMPIILMADRQTAGGYPKLANVASVDLRVLAQMAAPQVLRFALISLADAQRIYLAREREYSHVRQLLETLAR
jgi:urea carboxylase